MIHERLALVRSQLASISPHVQLLAVSKTKPASTIQEAYSAPSSHRHFAENYVQELLQKHSELHALCPEIRWHFIGALQSNKIKSLIEGVGSELASIQSIDSVSKLERVVQVLEQQEPQYAEPVELYLQVNISGEASKHGFTSIEELKAAFTRFAELPEPKKNCRLVGLMCIGEPEEAERDFARMNELKTQLQPLQIKLSMGMSADYLEAAKKGSDCVRVGSLIFGARS